MKRAKKLSGALGFQKRWGGVGDGGTNGLREINHEMRQQKGGKGGYLKGKKAIASTRHYEKEKKRQGGLRRPTMMHD